MQSSGGSGMGPDVEQCRGGVGLDTECQVGGARHRAGAGGGGSVHVIFDGQFSS